MEQMLALYKHSPKTPQEMVKRVLEKPSRIIKLEPSADRAIDRLVYKWPKGAYG